jgi:hypothetical protein
MQCRQGMTDPLSTPTSPRYLQIRGEVRARLDSICIDMPAPLFDQMVERIASVQLAYEGDPINWTVARHR